jgi:hypothetical protein
MQAREDGVLPPESMLAALDSELSAAIQALNELSNGELAAVSEKGVGAN